MVQRAHNSLSHKVCGDRYNTVELQACKSLGYQVPVSMPSNEARELSRRDCSWLLRPVFSKIPLLTRRPGPTKYCRQRLCDAAIRIRLSKPLHRVRNSIPPTSTTCTPAWPHTRPGSQEEDNQTRARSEAQAEARANFFRPGVSNGTTKPTGVACLVISKAEAQVIVGKVEYNVSVSPSKQKYHYPDRSSPIS